MPISDTYVVQYLLQETQAVRDGLVWTQKDPESYEANLHGIDVELYPIMNRAGTRFHLALSHFPERIDICEPINTGFFREKYNSEDEQNLAHLIRKLAGAAARQCAARLNRSPQATEMVRESIYRRLIGIES